MHHVKVEQFEGPFDLLLQLIEGNEMDISNVSLARVADEYLAVVHAGSIHPAEIADFLLIAARLLYLKSKTLLPQLVLDDDVGAQELEGALKRFAQFAQAARHLNKLYDSSAYAFERDTPPLLPPDFYPPKRCAPAMLAQSFAALLRKLEPLRSLPKGVLAKVVSLTEKIESLKAILAGAGTLCFSKILRSADSKMDAIVSFLALLELTKQRLVVVEQEGPEGEITIERKS
jgi:segregation and condensation protein A